MATFVHGKNAKLFILDSGAVERDISSVVTKTDLPITSDTAEVSAFGDGAKNYIPGLKDSTIAFEGSRDTTTEGYLFGVVGVSTTYAFLPEGSASGKIKYSGTVIGTGLTETSAVTDANKFSFTGQGAGTVTRTVL